MRILLVEDDLLISESVRMNLVKAGYTVDCLQNGLQAIHAVRHENFDIVLLDLGLPGADGLTVLRAIRREKIDIPVLIVTAENSVEQKVLGLDIGADDYLSKPFDVEEMIARIRALTRRAHNRASPIIQYGAMVLDPRSAEVTVDGHRLDLSRQEFAILEVLLENQGNTVPRDQLVDMLYGWDDDINSNSLTVHISNLRKKLGKDYIQTTRGVGYAIVASPK